MKTRTGLLLLICLNLLAFSAPAQILDFRGAVKNKALNRVNNRIDQTLDKGLNKVEGSIKDTLNKKNTSGAGGKTAAESTSQSANEKDAPNNGSAAVQSGQETYGIYFDSNSDKIKPESYGTLKGIATVLTENPGVKVKIFGHTD